MIAMPCASIMIFFFHLYCQWVFLTQCCTITARCTMHILSLEHVHRVHQVISIQVPFFATTQTLRPFRIHTCTEMNDVGRRFSNAFQCMWLLNVGSIVLVAIVSQIYSFSTFLFYIYYFICDRLTCYLKHHNHSCVP